MSTVMMLHRERTMWLFVSVNGLFHSIMLNMDMEVLFFFYVDSVCCLSVTDKLSEHGYGSAIIKSYFCFLVLYVCTFPAWILIKL